MERTPDEISKINYRWHTVGEEQPLEFRRKQLSNREHTREVLMKLHAQMFDSLNGYGAKLLVERAIKENDEL